MPRASKLALGFIVYSVTFIVILVAIAGFWTLKEYKKPSDMSAPLLFEVPSGSASGQIAQNLLNQKAFDRERDILIFKLALKAQDSASDLKAGEYEIPAHSSIQNIIALLKAGKVVQRQITLREGLTSYEIVTLISATEDLVQKEISVPAEGTLLPETYSYQKNETNAQIVQRMQKAMDEAQKKLWPARAKDLPFETLKEAITLASIVEKETGMADERAKVAGIFINRLKRGIPLQTDPTVIYAITKGKHKNNGKGPLGRRLLLKDLEIDSPYNTYKNAGLPPGPIANPGRASIEAVLHPEKHDYIYFVADGSGGHAFAKTLAGHNANVAKWRKIRRSKK